MQYQDIKRAVFLARPNRFIAEIELEGRPEICHVKNTGRCRELLIPGAAVVVQRCEKPGRRTQYDLIAVYKGARLINIDSSAPNQVFAEWVRGGGLFQSPIKLTREQRFGSARFDFYAEGGDGLRAFIEIKGVTLEEDGIARFPDAPTERGVKHLRELIQCVAAGYAAYIVFVIQMKGVRYLEPNWGTHPAFGEALRDAAAAGVRVAALDCTVTEDGIAAADAVAVRVDGGLHRDKGGNTCEPGCQCLGGIFRLGSVHPDNLM